MAQPVSGRRDEGTASGALSLFGAGAPEEPVALRQGVVVTRAQCIGDIADLALRLPEGRYAINLCGDRYWFIVAFAAAVARGHTSLMPPNRTPLMLEQLARRYPGSYWIVDSDAFGAAANRIFAPSAPRASNATLPSCSFAPDAPAAILFTSGSTGTPTAHEKRLAALVSGALAAQDALGLGELAGGHLLATVPPQHMYGLESSVLMPLLGRLVLDAERPFFPADVLARLSALPEPRVLVTTPVHLRALLADAGELPQVARILCATAPLDQALARAAEQRFRGVLVEIYGCTEVGQLATRRPTVTDDWQLLPGVKLSQSGDRTFAQSGHGTTPVALSDDIVRTTETTFRLGGRHADMINIGGKRASLADLNQQLQSIEGVEDGVFVVPDTDGSAARVRLAALVVAPSTTPARILAALRERIDAAFLPRPLRIVASLPRNAVGKLPKAELQRLMVEAEL